MSFDVTAMMKKKLIARSDCLKLEETAIVNL